LARILFVVLLLLIWFSRASPVVFNMRAFTLLASAGASINLALGAVQISFAKQHQPIAVTGKEKLAGSGRRSVTAGLEYKGAAYAVNATVGTPGQVVTLGLSTSSSSTWIPDARSSSCTTEKWDHVADEWANTTLKTCLSGFCK